MFTFAHHMKIWVSVYIFLCTCIYAGAQQDEGRIWLEKATRLEQQLYPTFTQEIFTNTVNAYHEAGQWFFHAIPNGGDRKSYFSYYCIYAWLQEAELREAMNQSRPICDIFVNTFDKLLTPKEFQPSADLTVLGYDTLYQKTLWILFYNTQECHKDLFAAKYGNLLQKYISYSHAAAPDIYIVPVQANLNIGLLEEAYEGFVAFKSVNKYLKLTSEQKLAFRKTLSDLKTRGAEVLKAEQLNELDQFIKKYFS